MKSYGQFCPVAKAAELFCERWTALILRELTWGSTRFSEIQRGVPLMSPTLLSRRLKQLEAEGIVERRQGPEKQPGGRRGASYHLTPAGQEFAPVVEALGVWGQRWSRRQLVEGEVDLGLLIWALERSVDPQAFGGGETVVRIDFTDQPQHKRLWWFVNRAEACELCVHDPGLEVGLYLACTLVDMIYIIRGDLSVSRALSEDRLEALGETRLCKAIGPWLNLSPLADIPSVRPDAVAI